MRFKPGQKVVCNVKGLWEDQYYNKVKSPAKFNEVYTVSWNGPVPEYHPHYVTLKEFGSSHKFREDKFEPIIEDSVLEAELQSITEIAQV